MKTKTKKKMLLSWKSYGQRRVGGRWCKQIDSKVKYFGSAESPSNIADRKLAEQAYHQFMATGKTTAPKKAKTTSSAKTISEKSLVVVVDKYVQDNFERYEIGEVSISHVSRLRTTLRYFLDAVGRDTDIDDIGSQQIEKFRKYVFSFPINKHKDKKYQKPISLSTAKQIVKNTKYFLQWAYRYEYLAALPRNIHGITKFGGSRKYLQEQQQQLKTYSLDELKQLWDFSPGRLRSFILLSLNCSMGAKDIADLRASEIDFDSGYIQRGRSKTGVIGKYKLWQETIDLIQEHRAKYN